MNKTFFILYFCLSMNGICLYSQEHYCSEVTDAYYLDIFTKFKSFDSNGFISNGGISKLDLYSLNSFFLFRSFQINLNIPDTSQVKIALYNQFRDSSYELYNRILPPNFYNFYILLKKNNLLVDKNSLYRVFIEAKIDRSDKAFEEAIKNNTNLDTISFSNTKYLNLMENKSIIFSNKIYVRLDTLK